MQIMAEKGLVRRNQDARSHIYEAAASEVETKKGLVGDLVEKAFAGSARDLILQALSTRKTSPDELSEIRRLIEEMERKKQ
jgi:predicted transcriptional regulator